MSESSQNHYTEIFQNRISYVYHGEGAPAVLDEASVEHVKKLIKQGFNQGELNYTDPETEKAYPGWWSIDNPPGTPREHDAKDRHTEILGHRICYHYAGEGAPESMDEASVEHVEKYIKQGYVEGELRYFDSDTDTEFPGWWSIDD